MYAAPRQMLPTPKPPKPKRKNTGIDLPEELVVRLDKIVAEYGVKSRNQLMASMLAFDVDLFPHIQRLGSKISEVEEEMGLTQVQAIVKLIEIGLGCRKKKGH